MDAVTAALGALGIFGIISAVLVGGLMLVLVPFWAIFDCAASRRETGTKILLIILLFFTWTLGALVYAVFLTDSRALRRFTIISTVIAVLLAIASAILLFSGAAIHSTRESERKAVEREEFQPAAIDPAEVAPFQAIHFVGEGAARGSAAVAEFTLDGPNLGSAQNIDDRVRHIVLDPQSGTYFGITQHEFGIVQVAARHRGVAHVRGAVGHHEHVAFCADDRADVDRFYSEVLRPLEAQGHCVVEDPPGECPEYDEGYYATFFFDPDGLKFEFVINEAGNRRRAARAARG